MSSGQKIILPSVVLCALYTFIYAPNSINRFIYEPEVFNITISKNILAINSYKEKEFFCRFACFNVFPILAFDKNSYCVLQRLVFVKHASTVSPKKNISVWTLRYFRLKVMQHFNRIADGWCSAVIPYTKFCFDSTPKILPVNALKANIRMNIGSFCRIKSIGCFSCGMSRFPSSLP